METKNETSQMSTPDKEQYETPTATVAGRVAAITQQGSRTT